MSALLETRDLAKAFGGLRAVDRVNLRIEEGEIHAVIGPNGAGKTTLFNVITGHLRPTSGRVFFRSLDITGWPPHRVARVGLARTFQVTNIFPRLTVLESVQVALAAAQRREKDLVADRVTVMHQGRIIAQGLPEEIRQNETVVQVYLGEHLE